MDAVEPGRAPAGMPAITQRIINRKFIRLNSCPGECGRAGFMCFSEKKGEYGCPYSPGKVK